MTTNSGYILALDVGEKRIGVAIASGVARLARPLTTLQNTGSILDEIKTIIAKEQVGVVVVGLPRGLGGQETTQTTYSRIFADRVRNLGVEIVFQDEALTSKKAKAELIASKKQYEKAAIDALAATYILEDYLSSVKPAGSVS